MLPLACWQAGYSLSYLTDNYVNTTRSTSSTGGIKNGTTNNICRHLHISNMAIKTYKVHTS